MARERTVAIIQARLGSTRLPGKVSMEIGGRPALEWVIRAAEFSSVDEVIVATPDLEIWSKYGGILGPEDDVLSRFILAAEKTNAERIVRLTADCPFVDPGLINRCISNNCCAVDEWPDGMDVQVFNSLWLPLGDREHVVPVNNNLPQLKCPQGNLRHIRVTLDTEEDLHKLRVIAEKLDKTRPPHWWEVVEKATDNN